MDFNRVIEERHSCRNFKNKSVSWKDAMVAIDAAIQGPYAGNTNNIKFLIIESPETIKSIAKHSQQTWIQESNILIAVCSDDSHLEKQYGERGRVYSRQQAGAAINTILLKLTDLGLASCWIGAFADESVKQLLGIPEHIQIEAIIPMGYENPSRTRKKPKKLALERAIYWETWKGFRRPSAFEDPNIHRRDAY